MNIDYKYFKVSDGHSLAYKSWDRVENPGGVIILIHGMAEHIERYDHFASYLNSKGYIVYGTDHRGHGRTSGKRGFFHLKQGWKKVSEDQVEFYNYISEKHKELDIYYFAHSMGSFILRHLLASYEIKPKKVILSGTGYQSSFKSGLAGVLAGIISKLKGPTQKALTLDKIVNGPFSKSVDNPVTKFDWLSRDSNQVAKYVSDSECGYICTNKFYQDLFKIFSEVCKKSKISMIDKELPILLYSGECDPLGGTKASDVIKLQDIYSKKGLNSSLIINKGGRHESINEINRDKVYSEINNFLVEVN